MCMIVHMSVCICTWHINIGIFFMILPSIKTKLRIIYTLFLNLLHRFCNLYIETNDMFIKPWMVMIHIYWCVCMCEGKKVDHSWNNKLFGQLLSWYQTTERGDNNYGIISNLVFYHHIQCQILNFFFNSFFFFGGWRRRLLSK